MLIVEIRGEQVWRRIDHSTVNDPLPTHVGEQSAHEAPPANCVGLFTDWSTRYTRAVESGNHSNIHLLGSEIYEWMDQGGALVQWASGPERELEIRAESAHSSALINALLATPWEIVCREGEFLAKQTPLFSVSRRCGALIVPTAPQHSDLSLMFMAAAPEGQNELDYEAEEAAIIDVTGSKLGGAPLAHVQVEESGALEFLAERLRLDGPFEVLHLSCHGDIVQSEDTQDSVPLPILLFETSTGGTQPVRPDELLVALEGHMPQLVFVSACRTAERGTGRVAPGFFSGGRGVSLAPNEMHLVEHEMRRESDSDATGSLPDLADPFVRQLSVQAPNVLGWDGSVYDVDAALFAEELYSHLARGETVPRAAALARRALFDAHSVNPQTGRHWHLARVYLGPGGGGVLCDPTLQHARPARPDPEVPFLDKRNRRVPVATRAEFVGRRRQIQAVIRSYRKGQKSVLIHGMGNLGKSSLAARVAARMPEHRIAVVFGECHALAVINALTRSLEEITDGMPLADAQSLQTEIAALTIQVTENDAALESALRRLLRGIFNTHPVLLILDDLEQSLLAPSAESMQVQPRPEYNATLKSVLSAFAVATTTSRCLLTSRYDFALHDGAGGDLTTGVVRVPLAPMRHLERQKQWQARARSEEQEATVASVPGDLIETALLAAAGNPGLQEVLTRPLLRGEPDAAQTAIAAINEFRATGTPPPAGVDVGDFFRRMAFNTYSSALSATQKAALTATSLFAEEIPIPRASLDATLQAYGIDEPQRALDRLLALGLLDDWGNLQAGRGTPVLSHCSTNPLARPLADKLTESDRQTLASAVVSSLATAWQDEDGDFPYDSRSIEVTRLALYTNSCEPTVLDAAAKAAVIYLYDLSDNAKGAVTLAHRVLSALEAISHPPNPVFLRKTITAAVRIGDVELQDALLEQVLGRDDIDNHQRALLLGLKGDRLVQMGELDAALKIRQEDELPVYEALGDKRSIAVTKGKIADILVSRGELDAALKIRQEDQLPVYEALGDKRELAIAKGQIADILESRGELDAALKIRQEDELPVYEALGDKRSIAVTKGQIADILVSRGELNAALKIRQEDQLPVYEALGDKRSIAVTKGKIADILVSRGELDAALKIRQEDELPVYEALGEKRSIAVTKGKIADILVSRGELNAALKIRQEDELPVYEALGDKRSIAVTKGQIADILVSRGELNAALKIRQEDELPVYEALGDKRELAIAKGQIADILVSRGELDAALKIRQEDELPVYEALGEKRSIAVTKGKIADILVSRGELNAALKIRQEDELPVYEALGDKRSIAVTKGQIADILVSRGELDAALKIRQEDQLPVYEALGDKRELAIAKGKIADILVIRGELDAALKIRQEDELPVYEALGDKRSIAVTKGQIADILVSRGELNAALKIRQEDQLPVYEALGDKRSIAVTKGQIADILVSRGELDAALKIRQEDQLPVYEALGEKRSIAVTKGKIADILVIRGELDAALKIRQEDQLPVYEALGDKRELAIAKGKIADILVSRGELDAALKIRQEDELPVYEALGDKRSIAVTKGQIADILESRGELDTALALHLERLPDAQAMQDSDSLIHIRFSCARIRLRRGDHQRDGAQIIYEELAEAFAGSLELQRPDAVGHIGLLLGQILAGGGNHAEAIKVLEIATTAFDKLEKLDEATQCRTLIDQLQGDTP